MVRELHGDVGKKAMTVYVLTDTRPTLNRPMPRCQRNTTTLPTQRPAKARALCRNTKSPSSPLLQTLVGTNTSHAEQRAAIES